MTKERMAEITATVERPVKGSVFKPPSLREVAATILPPQAADRPVTPFLPPSLRPQGEVIQQTAQREPSPGTGGPRGPDRVDGNGGDGNNDGRNPEREEREDEPIPTWWPSNLSKFSRPENQVERGRWEGRWSELREIFGEDASFYRTVEAAKYFEGLSFDEINLPENLRNSDMVFERIRNYDMRKKLSGDSPRVIELKVELENEEVRFLQRYTASLDEDAIGLLMRSAGGELREELENLTIQGRRAFFVEELRRRIDTLDRAQYELDDLEASVAYLKSSGALAVDDAARPSFYTPAEWSKTVEERKEEQSKVNIRRDNLQSLIDSSRAEIQAKSGGGSFLARRTDRRAEIKDEEDRLEHNKRVDEQIKKQNDPKEIIRNLQEIDDEPNLPPGENLDNIPPFSEVLAFYNEQRNLPPAERFPGDGLERAAQVLHWYFYIAQDLGITADLDTAMSNQYRKIREELTPSKVSPDTKIAFREQMDKYKKIIETNGEWEAVISAVQDIQEARVAAITAGRNLGNVRNPDFIRQFIAKVKGGIRGAYVDGAVDQILYQERRFANPNRNSRYLERFAGGFNISNQEILIQAAIADAEEKSGGGGKLFEDRGWSIELLGENEDTVIRAIEAFGNHLVNGSGGFDVNRILQKMEYLGQAITIAGDRLKPKFRSKAENDAYIAKWTVIRRTSENRIYFALAQKFASFVEIDNHTAIFDRWATTGEGGDRLREVPGMMGGLVGLCMAEMRKLENQRLLFRPEGHRGQLMNEKPVQNMLRDDLKTLLARELAKWRLREGVDLSKLSTDVSDQMFRSFFEERTIKVPGFDKELTIQESRSQLIKLEKEFEKMKKDKADPKEISAKWDQLEAIKEGIYDAETQAQNAVDFTMQVWDVLGESAKLGAPSIIADNTVILGPRGDRYESREDYARPAMGDHIRFDDAVYFAKYAVLAKMEQSARQHTTKEGRKVYVRDDLAQVRWRARMWATRWKNRTSDSVELTYPNGEKIKGPDGKTTLVATYKDHIVTVPLLDEKNNPILGPNGRVLTQSYELKEGFEETGLTKAEFEAYEDAFKELRRNGFAATINGERFSEIIKKDGVRAVKNNYLAVDYMGRDTLNNKIVRFLARKGQQPWIERVLKTLGVYDQVVSGTVQQVGDIFIDAIEDSRSFDAMATRMGYYEATREPKKYADGHLARVDDRIEQGGVTRYGVGDVIYTNKFSPERMALGFPQLPLGTKRLQYLPVYLMTILREKVARAEELLPWLPVYHTSLTDYLSADDPLQLIQLFNSKESFDYVELRRYGFQVQNAHQWRTRAEGYTDEKEGKIWGIFEKPTVDANGLWEAIQEQNIDPLIEKPENMTNQSRQGLVDAFTKVLDRLKVPVTITTKSIEYDRQAAGANAAFEELEKFSLRYVQWILSASKGSRREQGGREVNRDAQKIIDLIMTPNSYREGSSIWDEVWRKFTTAHNADLGSEPPKARILAFKSPRLTSGYRAA